VKIKDFIPKQIRPLLKAIYNILLDSLDSLSGNKKNTPPRSLNFVGDGDYEQTGKEFKRYFINLGGLKPNHKVLDVGCGIGRMALPLTDYLSVEGEYWGFDVVEKGIVWCQNNITTKFKNFNFQHANIYNKFYNKNGQIAGHQYNFPYDPHFFDFVFLTSVFTHMLPDELENYLKEIARVLKPEGKVVITFFLLNEESKKLIANALSHHDFKYDVTPVCKTINAEIPEDAVAYEESFILFLFEKYGFIWGGKWFHYDTMHFEYRPELLIK